MGDINGEVHQRGEAPESSDWSKMIEETVQGQGWSSIIERATGQGCTTCEIEEVEEENRSNANNAPEETYVAVGKDLESGLSTLRWALRNSVDSGGSVTLVHVFHAARSIPTPVGRIPRSQLTQDMVDKYTKDEERKRKRLLQNYLQICSDAKVKAETILIESEVVQKAIVDLISVLNITKLIIGTRSTNYAMTRRKLKLGPGKAEYVQRHAPGFCKVLVISDRKIMLPKEESEVNEPGSVHSSSSSNNSKNTTQEQWKQFIECKCFSRKFIIA